MVIGNYCSNKNCGHGYVNTLDGKIISECSAVKLEELNK